MFLALGLFVIGFSGLMYVLGLYDVKGLMFIVSLMFVLAGILKLTHPKKKGRGAKADDNIW